MKTRTMQIALALPIPEQYAVLAEELAAERGVPVEQLLTALGAAHLEELLGAMLRHLEEYRRNRN